MDRRAFLLSLLVPAVLPRRAAAGQRTPTPSQVEGPYYPPPAMRARRFPAESADLTRVGDTAAEGVRVLLLGRVVDLDGAPQGGARVEVWQTCHRGRYLHPADDWGSEIPQDPGFAYFGATETDGEGGFALLTVMPRRYPSGARREWWRPPHVHLKVRAGRRERLTTQLYFDDPLDPDNGWRHRAVQEVDRVLGVVPEAERHLLRVGLAPLDEAPPGFPQAREVTTWGPARVGAVEVVLGA